MDLNKVVKFLDGFFNTKQSGPDLPFSRLIPNIYNSGGIRLSNFVYPDFTKNFNGLMFKNADQVDDFFSTVFLSQDAIDRIANNDSRKLLITHHPMDDNTSEKGFLPLTEAYLDKIIKYKISIYSLHNPLDQNKNISSSKSIANALSLNNLEYFMDNEGVVGELPEWLSTEELLIKAKSIFGISDIKSVEKSKKNKRIAVVAGGGSEPSTLEIIRNLKPDAYITGEYISRIKNNFAEKERGKFNELLPSLDFSLIGASHYATESLVLKNELKKLLDDELGINLKFLDQEDSWY